MQQGQRSEVKGQSFPAFSPHNFHILLLLWTPWTPAEFELDAELLTTGLSQSSTIDTGGGSRHPLGGWWSGTVSRKNTSVQIIIYMCFSLSISIGTILSCRLSFQKLSQCRNHEGGWEWTILQRLSNIKHDEKRKSSLLSPLWRPRGTQQPVGCRVPRHLWMVRKDRVKYNDLKSIEETVWGPAGLRGARRGQPNHSSKHRSFVFNTRVKTYTFNKQTWCQWHQQVSVRPVCPSFIYSLCVIQHRETFTSCGQKSTSSETKCPAQWEFQSDLVQVCMELLA